MHTEIPSKHVDSDDACSGGFYFFFLLVKIFRTTLNVCRGEGNAQFLLTQDVLRSFTRYSYQSCSSMSWPFPVLHQFATYEDIFNRSYCLTSNDGLLNNELKAMRKEELVT
jgi:hypothetical protein